MREKLEFRIVPERFQEGDGDGKGYKGYGARCNNPEILGGLSFEDGRVSCHFFNLLLESFKIKNKIRNKNVSSIFSKTRKTAKS